jgi:rRNA maturation endonuclease Nob1
MEQIKFELVCDVCGTEYDLSYIEENTDSPIYCPFCGSDVDVSDVEESYDSRLDDIDELDFNDD